MDAAAGDAVQDPGAAPSQPAQAARAGTAPGNKPRELLTPAEQPQVRRAEQNGAAAPCAGRHAAGLLPDGYYVARTPAALAHALASESALSAGSTAPERRWGPPCIRPAGAMAWRAPVPTGPRQGLGSWSGLEPSSINACCLVRVMLHVSGRGVVREGAAVHMYAANPGANPDLGTTAAAAQHKHHRCACQVLRAAGAAAVGSIAPNRPQHAAPRQTGTDPGASPALGPTIGYVTSEAPRGAPASRGAVAVCQAAPLLAARCRQGPGGQGSGRAWQGSVHAARVLVANPGDTPVVCAAAVLSLEMQGNDEAAW